MIFISKVRVPGSPGLSAKIDPLTPDPGVKVPGTTIFVVLYHPPPPEKPDVSVVPFPGLLLNHCKK